MLKSCAGLVALSSLLLSGVAVAQEKIKVGVTATLEGTYTVLGEDGMRGFQTALNNMKILAEGGTLPPGRAGGPGGCRAPGAAPPGGPGAPGAPGAAPK